MECYFFGTFNPIHLGHIEIARKVKELGGFKRVIFVPSYMPPHKIEGLASYKQRLEMARLAVGENNVLDIELHLKVPSYTYRTVEKLCEGGNDKKINFIIGYDQFFKLESWREPEILKEKINFLVIPRKFQNGQVMGSAAFKYFKDKGYSFEVFNIDFLDVSSSMIRKYVENGQDIAGLTTSEVRQYIENNRLYTSLAGRKFIS
ncbi:nicotinate (nicotinamide) nucleotide adenylyltransferase [bacterium]|nr:nicotinate (nicotinamide) nucleotide adenylyltransferase [bacterium]MBQ9149417.1 nicotinate (nicotinamide) nucleotide adenylyltransferase [bacterium]